MSRAAEAFQRRLLPPLTALADNTYLAAIRAGMVAIVPLTIIGGVFLLAAHLPIPGWEGHLTTHFPILQVPVAATFGLLAVFVCFAIGYELGQRLGQDPAGSAMLATLNFLLLQLDAKGEALTFSGLGSAGLFTAIVIALVSVRVKKAFTDRNLVIRLPPGVPKIVAESFLSLAPMACLVAMFWALRFVLGLDLNQLIQAAFSPLVFALNTLPGILVYAFLVTLLWSVGINGDNAMDAIVAPIFLQYLADNVAAITQGLPAPYVTANGFFSTFVNVGGTGATLALALLLLRSPDPALRQVCRLSLPTQVFQINEPIFFGIPIVLNPLLMIPYVLNALLLTTGTYLLMQAGWIGRPFLNIPWTTPPIIGHYLVTGGDWRAALWGAISIGLAMLVYLPFARLLEFQRLRKAPAPAP
ncbi:MAG: PTS sugar transporter subunit IIC [Verrucomicrobia bacterium]|nr:PTS sugar transporter subunit IIC [Verrucomicrobiota bacterium]